MKLYLYLKNTVLIYFSLKFFIIRYNVLEFKHKTHTIWYIHYEFMLSPTYYIHFILYIHIITNARIINFQTSGKKI